jgi:hypothetical protein
MINEHRGKDVRSESEAEEYQKQKRLIEHYKKNNRRAWAYSTVGTPDYIGIHACFFSVCLRV